MVFYQLSKLRHKIKSSSRVQVSTSNMGQGESTAGENRYVHGQQLQVGGSRYDNTGTVEAGNVKPQNLPKSSRPSTYGENQKIQCASNSDGNAESASDGNAVSASDGKTGNSGNGRNAGTYNNSGTVKLGNIGLGQKIESSSRVQVSTQNMGQDHSTPQQENRYGCGQEIQVGGSQYDNTGTVEAGNVKPQNLPQSCRPSVFGENQKIQCASNGNPGKKNNSGTKK
ncbi:hypothetical protein NE237_000477 [Protea cynaroides]|uniref:Uncharacterized protein n=1 Tax=Protea cynaroides TaxID=273540 RepID=A0A9Q0KRI3_9MAGN|nr:hypothetical protein NE237_000477 [Protea cynaroides]